MPRQSIGVTTQQTVQRAIGRQEIALACEKEGSTFKRRGEYGRLNNQLDTPEVRCTQRLSDQFPCAPLVS